MGIIHVKRDLFTTNAGFIVHGCNAQGVMGSGVAKIVKQKYPKAFADYRKVFETDGLELGRVYWSEQPDGMMIGNAITQQNFGVHKRQVSYPAVMACFQQIEEELYGEIVAIPRIGAGLGGGEWEIIEEIIDFTVKNSMIAVYTPED